MFSAKKDKYVFEYEKNTNIKGQVNLTECHSSNKTYLLCVTIEDEGENGASGRFQINLFFHLWNNGLALAIQVPDLSCS